MIHQSDRPDLRLPRHRYRPVRYFALTLLITWLSFFVAAYCSFREALAAWQVPAMLIGLLAPFGTALWMIFRHGDRALRRDFRRRITDLRLIRRRYLPALLLLVPAALFAAAALSLPLGQPASQFVPAEEFAVMNGAALLSLLILFLAPTFEELGWRGYGVDSLLPGRNLLQASLLFALLWALWHLPLFFIKGYYHYEILHEHPLYAIHFALALIPVAIIGNWLYFRNGRSITALILFHFVINLIPVAFPITQPAKAISTLLLGVVCVLLVRREWGWWTETVQRGERETRSEGVVEKEVDPGRAESMGR